MSSHDRRLLRHLLTAVLVKLLALTILWWAFFHERHPRPALEDSTRVLSDHILGTAPAQGDPL